ncbi:MAG: glyoxylate/hydroxypyruvate reductase A [Paracoccaceae bacterium]
MQHILYAGNAADWPGYAAALPPLLAARGIEAKLAPDIPADQVDYIIYAPDGPVQDFSGYTKLRAVFSLWAGVEKIIGNPTLTVPLTRMVDAGLAMGMRDYVAGHVLRHHIGMDTHIHGQDGKWRNTVFPPLARDRTIGILGLGALGANCGQSLAQFGFKVIGWSRTAKEIDGIDCFSGEDSLSTVLERAEILVLLLPYTEHTHHVLNAARLAQMRPGSMIINPGRGGLLDEDALLAALNSGHIAHATLDVFHTEPLPAGHPFWAHPRVTVTPHIAASSRAETCAEVLAENIVRSTRGDALLYLVDRNAGY